MHEVYKLLLNVFYYKSTNELKSKRSSSLMFKPRICELCYLEMCLAYGIIQGWKNLGFWEKF